MNILIVKPSSLGDIIHTLPMVPLIRRNFPDAAISWVVNEEYARLLDLCPEVDNVIIFRRRRWSKMRCWPELIGFAKDLKRLQIDLALDFQGLFRSGLITRLSGSPRRVGFRNAREGAIYFYNERILLPANLRHAVERNLFLLQTALHIADPIGNSGLAVSRIDMCNCEKLFRACEVNPHAPFLGLAPAARWESKAWPPDFFAAVVEKVHESLPELPVILLGSASERPIGEIICSHCRSPGKIVNLMGETELGTLVEILRHSKTIMTNDSGPMHLAAMLGTPVVAMFGPTDPSLTGPYGHIHRVFAGACDRAPCLENNCPKGTNACHYTISRDQVAEAVLQNLQTDTNPVAPNNSSKQE